MDVKGGACSICIGDMVLKTRGLAQSDASSMTGFNDIDRIAHSGSQW
jgi:hypothetical protein